MISHHHKCIFIHIPKTGGQSIERVFCDLLGLTWQTRAPLLLRHNDKAELGPEKLAHLNVDEYVACKYITREMFDSYFKFAFVRNPWSRVVSLYKYYRQIHKHRSSFRHFVLSGLDELLSRQDFHVKTQSSFVISDGKLSVDYVGRFENLQKDFYKICELLSLPSIELPHSNRSFYPRSLSLPPTGRNTPQYFLMTMLSKLSSNVYTNHREYQDYYDSATISKVASFYQNDIIEFGYDFSFD